ncbi:MAG TPA: siderophore-interacting protein [Streptosporangiaceae bacterium]|jgi:NADPH-dependent ferric siderophore reductase
MTQAPRSGEPARDPFAVLTGPLAGTIRMQLTVTDSSAVTPHMQRIQLTAPELASFEYLPGQDVMLMVDRDGDRPVRRRYSIRGLDRDRRLLTLDIVRHSAGPGERWVRDAAPGVTVEGIGPRGKITAVPDADWHLFAGDESSLAAIFSMVNSLPAQARATVILEIPDPADQQELHGSASLAGETPDGKAHVELTWLPRDGRPAGQPDALVAAVQAVDIPAGRPHAYLIGEARVVLALREALAARGLPAGQMSPKAYWGQGKANASHGEPAREG